jgi:[protein-PII] uridylyltransferase
MSAVQQSVFDQIRFEQQLSEGKATVQVYRDTLRDASEQIEKRFMASHEAATLVHARAELIDQILIHAWGGYFSSDDPDIALVAVGGYGRGELHPGSDIDILILLRSPEQERYREELEKYVMFLWDIGLEIGQSVRSLSQCVVEAEQDITIATNLLEARQLAGPAELFENLRNQTGPDKIWSSRAFFEAKLEEQTKRHHKYDDSAYNLEPNIKEGPGGLRDIQMIGWVAKRHFNADTLHDLVKHDFLTEEEYFQLLAGQNFLWQVRFALHLITKRHEDRLLFDYQHALANIFGYRDENANLAVEQFMKKYYRTIKELSLLNEMLLQHFQEAILYADSDGEPTPINKRFQTRKGFIEVTDENIFNRYPFALLEVFLLIQQHPDIKGVRASTIRLIRSHRHLIDDAFREDLRNRSLFMEILRQPKGISHELRRMNRYGILARYIPAFGNIVGLMQYDLFHIYTVDEHTMMVIRNIRRLTVKEHARELPVSSKVMRRIPKPELLYLAGMFHDIAKGRGGDHSELGAKEAMHFCLHHGLNNYDANIVAWLVKNHLIMSTTAQRKDISDPDVITDFATLVGDTTRLDYLYLLTTSDMRGTNHTIWNDWKATLLYELYEGTRRALRRGLENPQDHSEYCAEIQKQALEILDRQHVPRERTEHLWKMLSEDYFMRHAPEEIAWHSEAILTNDGREYPLILVQQHAQRGGTEIFIHMPIADHLFAASTGTFERLGLTVADARIITSEDGYAYDTYILLEENGEAIQSEHRIEDILNSLRHELQQDSYTYKKVTLRTARQLKHFKTPTNISFSQDTRNQRTVMELITGDRPGLLSKIGRALMDCNIYLQNAKIATIGERVEDAFFISDKDKLPITDDAVLEKLRQTIIDYLED